MRQFSLSQQIWWEFKPTRLYILRTSPGEQPAMRFFAQAHAIIDGLSRTEADLPGG